MNYREKLKKILSTAGPEIFQGQHEEIKNMTYSPGCDICEHTPTLIDYARQVNTIFEMGVRFGWSTRSFLFGRPKKLTSLDRYNWESVKQNGAEPMPNNGCFEKYKSLYDGVVDFKYVIADSTKIDPIEEVDLLFIDTFHHRDPLAIELAKHGNQAKRFIIMHDTETFGECGQADDSKIFYDQITTNEPGTGLWYAINPFLVANPHWKIKEIYKNNNGLTVLERSA